MLTNRNNNETKHVNFVSYTGSYPNLCGGVLTLEIDGKEITFGYGFNSKDKLTYRPFWSSGGGLMPNYDGAWQDENFKPITQIFCKDTIELFEKVPNVKYLLCMDFVVGRCFKRVSKDGVGCIVRDSNFIRRV